MIPVARQQLADLLVAARHEQRQVRDVPAEFVPASHTEGYRVNALVAAGLEQGAGWAPLGWKIAGTNPVMQQRLKSPSPIYGRTYQPFLVTSPAAFRCAELLDPIIECEIMLRLGRDLPPRAEPYASEEVADAVSACHAGVEVAECRFPLDALPDIALILADGAASGRYVLGPEIANWRSPELAAMAVTLAVDGQVRRGGSPREIMRHPLNALTWLANQRADPAAGWGAGLQAGELVSTGTCTGMLLARPGQRMVATFAGVGEIHLAFG